MHFRNALHSLSLVLAVGFIPTTGVVPAAQAAGAQIQVAQTDIGMFVDSRGRRVYFDRRTQRIIAVEEPGTQPRSLLDRIFPNSPQRAPQRVLPPPSQGGFPAPPPAPETVAPPPAVERQPLDGSGQASSEEPEILIRRLEDFLNERRDGTQPQIEVVPSPDDEFQQVEPGTQTEPEVRSAAIPRAQFDLPKSGDVIAKLQVLLDREGFSPGVIDGEMGSNVQKALDAYIFASGERINVDDEIAIEELLASTGGPAFTDYVITRDDAYGSYISSVPIDYGEKAKLKELSYTSPAEMLAERFHMAEDYLVSLNPDVNFYQPGTTIRVANPGKALGLEVARIEADKYAEQVRAYDANGELIAAYPATIGSTDTPSPSGTVQVERIAFDPDYTYNPKINFTQGNNTEILTIPPGPNGPVGSIWIALSKPTYGIHGTPEPDRIGKNNSHGCVRLTNWDATELAKMVSKGVTVQFID